MDPLKSGETKEADLSQFDFLVSLLWVRGPRDSLVPACRCQSVTGLDFGGSSADVKVQSAEWLRRSGRLAGRLVGAWVEVRKTPRNCNLTSSSSKIMLTEEETITASSFAVHLFSALL